MKRISGLSSNFPKCFGNFIGMLEVEFKANEALKKNHGIPKESPKKTLKFMATASLISSPQNGFAWAITSAHNFIKRFLDRNEVSEHFACKATFSLRKGCQGFNRNPAHKMEVVTDYDNDM